jgi:hypothetical protein
MMMKSDLLKWLQYEYQEWQVLLDQIDQARWERPGVNGDWSMKDIVAHLTGWNRWLVTRLQAAVHGEPEPAPPWPAHLQTDDEINAWIYESNRARPAGEVTDEMHQVIRQLLALIQGLPEDMRIEQLEPTFCLVWVGDEGFEASEFFNHFHDDHEPDDRAWLERIGERKQR